MNNATSIWTCVKNKLVTLFTYEAEEEACSRDAYESAQAAFAKDDISPELMQKVKDSHYGRPHKSGTNGAAPSDRLIP